MYQTDFDWKIAQFVQIMKYCNGDMYKDIKIEEIMCKGPRDLYLNLPISKLQLNCDVMY